MQGIPLLFGSTGEILTEKSGNLNLGIPGIMYVGGISGVIGAFFYEQSASGALNPFLAVLIPILSSLLGRGICCDETISGAENRFAPYERIVFGMILKHQKGIFFQIGFDFLYYHRLSPYQRLICFPWPPDPQICK